MATVNSICFTEILICLIGSGVCLYFLGFVQEYGITKEEKLDISERVCFRLLRKFHGDLKHADKSESTTRLDPK